MAIKTEKSEPDFTQTGAAGDPTIKEKSAETEVLVKDGDTTVIGGIYTRTVNERTAGVPFLSKIPILGWLFRKTESRDDRSELLIFITPRIVNRDEALIQTTEMGIDKKE
jgi:type IV pilus assembly protein PilQ